MLRRIRRSGITLAYLLGAALLVAMFLYIPRDQVLQPLHAIADPAATSLAMISEISKLIMTLDAAMLAAFLGILATVALGRILTRGER